MKLTTGVMVCGKDDRAWDEYFLLLMRRYADLGLPYDFGMTLSFIGNPIVSGNALIALAPGGGQAVGALGFVFGTGADEFTDETVCQIEIVYVEPPWRHTGVLAELLLKFSEYIRQHHPAAEHIQFWAPADRPDLHRMFAKFSDCVKTNDKPFGRISLYKTTVARVADYARRFQRRAREGRAG